jgi:hypothetical protein
MLLAASSSFIEPCLPSAADRPPSGSNWIHEIKHDGYRLMARRDPVGIRLITRRGNDWTTRFTLVVEAMNHLKVRSCLIDARWVCCDEMGLARTLASLPRKAPAWIAPQRAPGARLRSDAVPPSANRMKAQSINRSHLLHPIRRAGG